MMKALLRNILAVVFASAILFSTTGVLLRKHYCRLDAATYVSMIAAPDPGAHSSCCSHDSCNTDCCADEAHCCEPPDESESTPCCSDSFVFYKIPTFFSYISIKLAAENIISDVPPQIQCGHYHIEESSIPVLTQYRPPPPVLYGKAFLQAIHQLKIDLL